MDCLKDTCFLCLKNNIKVQSVLFQDTDGIVVNEKLRCFFPEIIDFTPDAHKLSCSECLEKLRISYDFKQSVIQNNTMFRDYIKKLQCQHKSHQELTCSKYGTSLPIIRDDTAKKVEYFDEKYDRNNLKIQYKNLNFTSTNEKQLNTHDHSCQFNTNENVEFVTKVTCQAKETNLKIDNIEIVAPLKEIEEIYLKQESFIDEDFNTKYLVEDSKEYDDVNSTSNHSGYNKERTNKEIYKKQYNCRERPKVFTTSNYLEVPSAIHTRQRPFKCQICQKTFTMSRLLDKHKVTHTGETPHDCDICQKSFNTKSDLIMHKHGHDTVRPYECPVCKKTFTRTDFLTAHMFIHSGQKPFQCNICQYKCTQAGYLKNHMRTHTGERPYACKHCRKSYVWPIDLKRHVKKHHNEDA